MKTVKNIQKNRKIILLIEHYFTEGIKITLDNNLKKLII